LAGEMAPLTSREGCQTPLATKRAHELHDAFSGSGKQHILEEAIKNKEIQDLRLQRVLVAGLEDKDAGFANQISEKALPMLGKAALPELLADLDIAEGDVGDARRLQAICRIDKTLGLELTRKALAEGSVKMVVQALESLPEVASREEAEKAGLEYSK